MYRVEKIQTEYGGLDYEGYIDGEYAGHIQGCVRFPDLLEVHSSSLMAQFKGGKNTIRAFREIIDSIQKDFKYVTARIDNQSNDSLKIALSHGFNVIGTTCFEGKIGVDLMRTRTEEENNNG